MARYLLEMFGISLALTWIIELVVGYCMGMRGRKYTALILLVNVLTNPAAVLVCWLGVPQLPVEIVVFLAEALIYAWFSRDENWMIPHPLLLSLVANLISWTSGIVIQMIGG